ncbi:MAG: hypothetical protein ACLQVI_38790 [Polyangiaceae bacterium]
MRPAVSRILEAVDARWAAPLGFAGASALGLLAAHASSAPLVAYLNAHVARAKAPGDMIERTEPTDAFRTYASAMAVALAVVVVFGLLYLLARRVPRGRLWLGLATPLAALGLAAAYHAGAIVIALAWVALSAIVLLPSSDPPETPAADATSDMALLAFVLGGEAVCLTWGVWLTQASASPARMKTWVVGTGLVTVAALAASFANAHRPLWSPLRSAWAFAPLCLTPLFGLARSPSWVPLVALVALCFALRFARTPARARLPELPLSALALVATWGLMAILYVPLRLRDLPNINFDGHEGGQYAWVSSAFRGKLLMADCSTIYGPLREYVLAAYMLVFGKTGLAMRIAQVWVNVIGLAVVLPVLWKMARGSLALAVMGAYAVLVGTHAFVFLDYAHNYSFGWADFARTSFPTALAFSGVAAVGQTRRRWLRVLVGLLAGFDIFYVQELGPLACVALVVGVFAAAPLATDKTPAPALRRRMLDAAAASLDFGFGVLVASALFLLPYLVAGKLRLFGSTIFFTASVFNAGYASHPFPIKAEQFFSATALHEQTKYGGLLFEYVLPPAIYLMQGGCLVAKACRGAFTRRDAQLTSLLLFSIVSFRVAMGRTDSLHLFGITLPAVLLFVSLAGDLCHGVATALSSTKLEPGLHVLVAAAGIFAASGLTGNKTGLALKLAALRAGDEKPSTGEPYDYPEIPRAGDIRLAPETIELVTLLRHSSSPDDAIFYRGKHTFGGELYFLADRRNPTRFDQPLEIFTRTLQAEMLRDLERDKPKLVITGDTGFESAAMRDFFAKEFHPLKSLAGVTVLERNAVAGSP